MKKLLLHETFCGNKLNEEIWNICEYNQTNSHDTSILYNILYTIMIKVF